MEGATGLGGFDGVKGLRCHRRFRRCHRRCDGVIEGFDGAIEGATVSYRRCHRRCDGACRFRRCHRRCGGVIKGFDGVIEASSGVRVPPQVRAGSRKVRTDLARKFATAASIDQILFSIVVVSVSSRVCCFLFLLWRFRRLLRLGVSRLAVLVS